MFHIISVIFAAYDGFYSFSCNFLVEEIQGLDKIIGTLPFLVLYLKRPTRTAPIVEGLDVFFKF